MASKVISKEVNMKLGGLKVHLAEEWKKTVDEAAEEAYALLNSDKRRA